MYHPTPNGMVKPKGLSDEKATRMLAALRSGQTLRKFCVKTDRIEAYLQMHLDYAQEARPLIKANAEAARIRKGRDRRNQTHCMYGHSLADARVSTRSNGRTMRACRTCQSIRAKEAKPLPLAQADAVKAALMKGYTVGYITGVCSKHAPRLVNAARFYNARKFDPQFDRFVLDAIVNSNSNGQKLRWARERAHAATDARREEANDYQQIRAMLPAYLPGRDDIAQDIFLALFEKSLRREDVAGRVKSYITDHNRRFPTQFAKFGNSPLVSLDEQIFEDGTTTRGDTVSRSLWD